MGTQSVEPEDPNKPKVSKRYTEFLVRKCKLGVVELTMVG